MFRSKNDFHSQHKRYNRPPSWPRLIWRYVVVLTYYPIHISLALKEKVQETYENSEYLYRKNLAEQMRPPVVTKRKRALTIPRSDNERTLHTRKQKTYDQTQSYLLQLPIELRFLIWEACIGSDDIYILLTNELSQRNARDHLEAFRNTEVSDEPVERLGEIQEDVLRNIEQRRRQRTRLDVLALLQTCRLVYSEVLRTLYCKPTFTFCDIQSFLAFSGSLIPHRLNQITRIKLDFRSLWPDGVIHVLETTPAHDSGGGFSSDLINKDINYRRLKASNVIFYSQLPHSAKLNGDSLWHVACQILSKMHGLKDLSIIMDHDRYCPRSGTIEDDIFEPMKPLYRKDLNKFTAYLDWRPIFDTSDPALPPQVLGPPPSLPVHQSLPIVPLRWTLVDGQLIWTKIEDE